MELTGKCKEEFEKWYIITYFKDSIPLSVQEHCAILECFDDCFKSMRYGVLEDYFDSVGVNIEIQNRVIGWNYKEVEYLPCCITLKGFDFGIHFKTRPEARTAAIEKANELRNEVLNKKYA